MRPKHVLTALAIFAVTGAVSVPNSLAGAWRLDVSDRHVVDRGGLEWNPLIHTVGDMGDPPKHNPEYQTLGHPGHGPIPFTNRFSNQESGHTRETGSSSNESQSQGGHNPSDFLKGSSGSLTAPFSETIYGGVPSTPSADPSVRDLSRD